MRYLLMLIPTCLISCLHEDEKDYERTPAGWKVQWVPEGSEAAGLYTKGEVFLLFDLRMQEALSAVGGVRDIGEYEFTLIDNASFVLDNGLHAAGMWEASGKITVCLYEVYSLPPGTPAPDNALPWTVYTGAITGSTYYATYPVTRGFPALEHELGHANGDKH